MAKKNNTQTSKTYYSYVIGGVTRTFTTQENELSEIGYEPQFVGDWAGLLRFCGVAEPTNEGEHEGIIIE